ncbi:MAG: thiamine-phosphate kinase [Pirellulaceae bacterium]
MPQPFEFQFHEWLCETFQADGNDIEIGDDAAVCNWSSSSLVISTDSICEGVHFPNDFADWELVGRKALAVSLSDIAAMGALPALAVVQLTLSESHDMVIARRIMNGIQSIAVECNVRIVGGDTNRWSGLANIGTTVIGHLLDVPWKISNAQTDDILLVTGPLGGSIRGKHFNFAPRFDVVRLFHEHGWSVNAATDISDSLSIDLAAMLEASNKGCLIEESKIPISDDAKRLAEVSGKLPIEHALSDGEDFELLISVNQRTWDSIQESSAAGPIYEVGRVTEDANMSIRRANGVVDALIPKGYEH